MPVEEGGVIITSGLALATTALAYYCDCDYSH